jgi:hypothetical protein
MLRGAEAARVSNFFRSGEVNLDRTLRFGFGGRGRQLSTRPARCGLACPLIEAEPAQVIGASATAATAGLTPKRHRVRAPDADAGCPGIYSSTIALIRFSLTAFTKAL